MFRDDKKNFMQTNPTKAEMVMLIFFKITLNLKFVTGGKQGHCIIHPKAVIILYIHSHNTRALKYTKQILRELSR